MAKPEWGTKRICTSCGARFYDFQKTPIICPKCEAENKPQVLLKPKRTPTTAAAKPASKPVQKEKPTAEKDLVVEDEDDGDDDGIDEDADDGVVLDDDEVALTGLSGETEDEDDDDATEPVAAPSDNIDEADDGAADDGAADDGTAKDGAADDGAAEVDKPV